MVKTYTYTARNAENPEQVVTFTLRDSRMSVGVGAPLEQVGRAVGDDEGRVEQGAEAGSLWLRPLAVSLIERGTRPVHVDDVVTDLEDDWLRVRAWIRAGGLRLIPITLIDGRVDNLVAAQDFVEEIQARKTAVELGVFGLLDYWGTWIAAGILVLVTVQRLLHKGGEKEEA
ncbi:MAG: hypothetical protein R6V13_05920 [Anaerolineae bacterium]